MERFRKLVRKQNLKVKTGCLLMAIFISVGLYAQNKPTVTGRIIEEKSNQPLPFATVRLMKISETNSHFAAGAISDEDGTFFISPVQNGNYRIEVTSVGYKWATRSMDIITSDTINAGTIYLHDSVLFIAEAEIVGKRTKGKSEGDKTIYFMNKKILEASGNAPDMLRHIPGVQVDLKQNISLEGSQNILLFVDGKERDKSYISQLNPSRVDRIEVLNTPPSNYDGNVSGVINIILKKERDTGVSGHVFSEIPTSKSVVYSFPAYSLNYSFEKINLYTSYNGEINYENIEESTSRQTWGTAPTMNISSVQHVRQKNLSHKFHYGIDYYITSRDVLSFYGFYNPYSYEQDGNVIVSVTGSNNQIWNTQKEETDKNRNLFNSLYYKHEFNEQGREITIDINNAFIRSNNTISYLNDTESGSSSYINTENPRQTTTSIKIDFTTPLGEKFKLSTGTKANIQSMHDKTSNGFHYNEQVYAIYGAINYQRPKFDFNIGLRAEDAETELVGSFHKSTLYILPYTSFRYKLSAQQNLQFSYRRSVNRPSVYYLNPYTYIENPYAVRKGNPLLEPEFRDRFYMEHSIQFRGNYISSRLFYDKETNTINNLTSLNDSSAFETQLQNLGTIHQYGVQFSGSLSFGLLTFNPSVRVYNQSTFGNNLAKQYDIKNRNELVFELGFSSVLSFKHNFAFSLIFQYNTARNNIQDNAFSDGLYFISLDKTFKKNLKVGIVSALPFTKNFVYQGSKIEAQNFSSQYTGNLKLPAVPIMFRVSYQFNIGKNRAIIKRDKEKVDTRPKTGL
ncbi:MAG: TonB-dependent receptor [Bacteroidetes bacterium]|nr:TonB-dependent receptor [Bacteroidota bacterium]